MKKDEKAAVGRKTSIGGQALIEGIMMRGPGKIAMAVRRPNGEVFFEEQENKAKKRPAICRFPIIRGVFGFIDSIVLGYRCLSRSAEIFCEEPELQTGENEAQDAPCEAEKAADTAEATAEPPKKEKENKSGGIGKGAITAVTTLAAVLGFALVLVLFVWFPAFLFEKIPFPPSLASHRLFRSAFEGILKVMLLVGYMAAVSLMKDIRRTFMYHGAEHKTIFCYEHGQPLTVENVRAQRRFHPRCGTSFLILMLLVSILVGMFIPLSFPGITSKLLYTLLRSAIKIALIPLIMGIGYELLKFAGRHDNILTKIISAPGLWLQRITVREPTDDMIECAIMAFKAVVPPDESDNW